ncbi:hypothetical protein GCM10009661_28260 [Catellatospora chokoriensis]|uniref:Uncharacterized protein n=1 Tax=Catellatospora chokoriensis TaxID=310353 RepID=A0A8J3KFZ8_9ACTN|nr:hypothetical protein Cch02nite_78180 [Catellatospora chokoriensis]
MGGVEDLHAGVDGDRRRVERLPVAEPAFDGGEQRLLGRGEQVRAGRVGNDCTRAARPVAASASRALRVAAPQAMRRAQPVGSATGRRRAGPARTSMAPLRLRNRQGWLLCGTASRAAWWRPGRR